MEIGGLATRCDKLRMLIVSVIRSLWKLSLRPDKMWHNDRLLRRCYAFLVNIWQVIHVTVNERHIQGTDSPIGVAKGRSHYNIQITLGKHKITLIPIPRRYCA